jgi:CRISPR-associated endonuclease/helicase Cas3
MRGVEREELSDNFVFKALSTESRRPAADPDAPLGRPSATVYLIGTSAAEVGVDTDADVILCDFASMDILVQRLGRLDRLGMLTAAGQTPTMRIFGRPKPNQAALNHAKIVCTTLGLQPYVPSAVLLAGNAWAGGPAMDEIISSATATVLADQACPAEWRHHARACATVKPTFCQPLTPAILEHWTATSLRPNPNLPVDPWLYGFGEEDSTPLVGIIFRRELDAMIWLEDEEPDDPDAEAGEYAKRAKKVLRILDKFSPAKSEAHWVPIYLVRDWLLGKLEKNKTERSIFDPPALLALRDENGWCLIGNNDHEQETLNRLAFGLHNESILILPTLADLPKPITEELTNNNLPLDRTDRADDAWGKDPSTLAKWLRTTDNAVCMKPDFIQEGENFPISYAAEKDEKGNETKAAYTSTLRYFLPQSVSQSHDQLLTDHQESAKVYASELARCLFRTTPMLADFYGQLGLFHDAGKASPLWQNAIGNRAPKPPLAKTAKDIHPSKFQGYRHEWGSLTADDTRTGREALIQHLPAAEKAFYSDLFNHLIGTHHGHLRPSLPDQPNYHPAQLDAERCAAALRWHDLQTMLGSWRLAYLEALLKAADTLASKDSDIITTEEG